MPYDESGRAGGHGGPDYDDRDFGFGRPDHDDRDFGFDGPDRERDRDRDRDRERERDHDRDVDLDRNRDQGIQRHGREPIDERNGMILEAGGGYGERGYGDHPRAQSHGGRAGGPRGDRDRERGIRGSRGYGAGGYGSEFDRGDFERSDYSRGRHESGAMMHGDYSGGSIGRAQGAADLWSEGSAGRGATSGGRGMHAGRGPKNYRRSDERIHEDVCEALTRDADVDATEIEVQVKEGEVTLSGTVDGREAKRRAEDVAERCAGVRDVLNQLRISRGERAQESAR